MRGLTIYVAGIVTGLALVFAAWVADWCIVWQQGSGNNG